ncbi:DUF3718 domain-containing protein [Bowmanella yangjiangensis]|uniref:DUF3718 domain-containing protein n=1 Tax=Bowmanella yangjiangensis TaxID=2811230 RepID=A0ABS3CQQ2_9ALTE|nr:DUF3718 domain-containing protein [Bowmanella yangjiangensis]MBN7819422.1 DUF3718 domain-containing protein [Bowmanella yangjiangensis]
MSPLQKLTCTVLLLSPLCVSAKNVYVAADDMVTTKLCVSAAMDTPIRFHILQQHSGLSARHIANDVQCNGKNIGDFAYQAGNTKIAKRLNRLNPSATYTEIQDIAKQGEAKGDKIIHVSGS